MYKQARVPQLVFVATLVFPVATDARPQINYGLSLKGDIWGSSFSSTFDFDDDFSLSGMNMRLSGPLLRAQAGDVSANWDQLGLAGRSFQGLSTGFPVGKIDLSLLGGTVVLQPDIRERQFGDLLQAPPTSVVSHIYGVRASLPLGNSLTLNASQFIAPDAPEVQSKSISTLALNYQHSARQNVGVEMAHSRRGSGWQVSGVSQGQRLRLHASYRHADLGFSSAGNPALITRRNGGFLNGSLRLAEPLTLTANLQRYTNGMEGCYNSNSVALRYAKRRQPTLSLFWRSAETQGIAVARPAFTKAATTSHASTSMGLRISHRLGVNRVSAQMERLQFNSAVASELSDTSNRLSVSLSRPLGRQTQLSLVQILDMGKVNQTGYTSLDIRRRIGSSGLAVDLGLQYVNHKAENISGQATSVRTGFSHALRSGSSIDLQYQMGVAGSGSFASRSINQLYVGYSHSFNTRAGRRQNLSLQERRQLGKVSGRVFDDSNGNGKWESGERGVPDVGIYSSLGLKQQTDSSGRFNVSDVRPGTYRFDVETKTLPIEFTTLSSNDAIIEVAAGNSAMVDIPVVRTGQAQGVVFQDANRNGLCDTGEKGVANAMVSVEGSDIIGFTDSQGHFILHGMSPRKWKIAVDTSIIDKNIVRTGSGFVEITVPPNGVVVGVDLGIAEEERPVIDSFQDNQ